MVRAQVGPGRVGLGRVALAETARTAPTGSAGLMSIDPTARGGPRRAATDRDTAGPRRFGVLPAPAHRPRAGLASASVAPMAPARLPKMNAASVAGASAAEAAPKGPSIVDRDDPPGRGEAARPSTATARPSTVTGHLCLVTGRSRTEIGHLVRAAIGRRSTPAAPIDRSPARAATDHRSIRDARPVRQHGSTAPRPRPVAPGARSTHLRWVRTRSSSPVAAR